MEPPNGKTLEVELKWTLLHPDPIPELSKELGAPVRMVEQLNRYFTPEEGPSLMVRLREQGGGLVLTVKRHGTRSEQGVTRRVEHEVVVPVDWLPNMVAGDLSDEMEMQLSRFGVQLPLTYRGSTHNLRWFFRLQDKELTVDRTTFPDGSTRFELEFEDDAPETMLPTLHALMDRLEIPWKISLRGKFEQFLYVSGSL